MKSTTLLVRGHLKGCYLLLTVVFWGFIYFASGISIWLLAYPLLSLLVFYLAFLSEGGMELNFFTKVLLFLNPVLLALFLLYFLSL